MVLLQHFKGGVGCDCSKVSIPMPYRHAVLDGNRGDQAIHRRANGDSTLSALPVNIGSGKVQVERDRIAKRRDGE